MFQTVLALCISIGAILASPPWASSGESAETGGAGFPELTHHRAPKPILPDAKTSDWPRFLGPFDNGTSPETHLLRDWSGDGPNLVWEIKSGRGYAAPSIAGDRLVFFHRIGNKERVDCLHRETGRRFWSFEYPTEYRDRYGFGDGPRACPVLDRDRVFVYGAEGRFHCLSLETGELQWSVDLSKKHGVPQDYFGVVSSPAVFGDSVIVNVGSPGGPCIVALNQEDGAMLWTSGDQWGPSCASPVVTTASGKTRLFIFAGGDSRPPTGGLLCLDPKTGAIQSRFPFRSKTYTSVNASSPVVVDDRVFLSTSYKTGGILLGIDENGASDVLWRTQALGCHFMTPIALDGYLYGVDGSSGGGVGLTCIDLETGKAKWRVSPEFKEDAVVNGEKTQITLTTGLASLIFADGAFLCLGDQGHLLWLDLSPEGYREICRTRVFEANSTWTPPALSHGLLYVCQNRPDRKSKRGPRLLCFDLRATR